MTFIELLQVARSTGAIFPGECSAHQRALGCRQFGAFWIVSLARLSVRLSAD